MIDVRTALERVLSPAAPLAAERIALTAARGRVLAENVISDRDVPPFRNSAMDGYAFRFADLAASDNSLPLGETIPAGHVPRPLAPGEAAAIMTGSVVPDGADTVVRIEDTHADAGRVWIDVAPRPGANIREPGEDLRLGDRVLEPGRRLTPADIGVLASLGRSMVMVHRQPGVAILSTGDELVDLGAPLPPGKIANSNAYQLAAAVEEAGGVARIFGIVADSPEATRDAFAAALQADVVLSTGGVSMGSFDFVRAALADLGAVEHFWKVAQKPGKPLSFSTCGSTLLFGLPGNPVSTLVCFYVYVVPVLRRLLGRGDIYLPTTEVTLDETLRTAASLTEFVRCTLSGPPHALRARTTGSQSSGVLRSMSLCDALLIATPGAGERQPGERAQALLLNGGASVDAPF